MAESEVYTFDYNSTRVLLDSLGNYEQWVCWKWGPRRKNGKRSKLPCNPDTGELAKVNDGTTWGTWDEVCAGSEAGIGFMLTSDDPYSVLDLDNCRNPRTGQIAEWADELVREFGSLTLVSASGTGLHIWVEGMLPVGGFNNKQGIEGYSSRHFIVITGQVHAGERIESRQEALDALYGRLHPVSLQAVSAHPRSSQNDLDDFGLLAKARASSTGRKFEDLFDRGNAGGDHSRADYELLKMLAFWTGRNEPRMERLFTESALGQRKKWWDRKDYRKRSIERACRAVTKVYEPRGRPKETTREGLQKRIWYALEIHEWNTGRADAAASDFFSYTAILLMAHKANRLTLQVSGRGLAEAAGLGDKRTAGNSLRRLEHKHGVLTKTASGEKKETNVYTLNSVDHRFPKDPQTLVRPTNLTYPTTNHHCDYKGFGAFWEELPMGRFSGLRNGVGLGKVCGWILALVHGSNMSLETLSRRTGISPNHLKERYTNELVDTGLLDEAEGVYSTPGDVESHLQQELEDSGCLEAEKMQKERHEREREAYGTTEDEESTETHRNPEVVSDGFGSEQEDFCMDDIEPENFDEIPLKLLTSA